MPIPNDHTHQSALSCAAWVRACKITDEAVIHARVRKNWPGMITTTTIFSDTALLLTLVTMSGGFVWKLTRTESALRENINLAKEEVEAKQDRHLREFGETILAIRQKVSDVELYAANNYMRRDGFIVVKQEIQEQMTAMIERLEKRLERMEIKLDSKT